MRILLLQKLRFFPSQGGADTSDRFMMAALARRGHICRAVARIDDSGHGETEAYRRALAARGVESDTGSDGAVVFSLGGVTVHVITRGDLRAAVTRQVDHFQPDVIVVSTDPLNNFIEHVTRMPSATVVYLARSTTYLPFGADAAFPSRAKTSAIRRAQGVVTVSGYLAEYIKTCAGIESVHLPIQMIGDGEWPVLGHAENPFVMMVNPCALKGLPIFLGLADAFPDDAFLAVVGWGTTRRDRDELHARPNIQVMEPVDDIRDILRQTRVTLVPSLWAEARARIVLESMLCGVPVLASDAGGAHEAVMGVPCVLPVNRIVQYTNRYDTAMIRVPETPPQRLEPWREALARLLRDRAHYATMARAAREAATRYAAALDIEPFESYLEALFRSGRRGVLP
jgi:glycosyltransferase involved in cell wall biosynthesis